MTAAPMNIKYTYRKYYNLLASWWWIKIAVAGAILAVGCGVGGIKYYISSDGEDTITKDAFKVYAATIFATVSTNWGNVLLAPQMMANLFLTNYTIDFETFARFSRPPGFWSSSFTYMQAIQFVPYVTEEDRDAFEASAQCAFPGYYMRERLPNGSYIPALPRAEHFPVYFNEPYQGNEGAMGLDNTATENRYMAYNTSRKTGRPSLSERILLVQVGQYGAFILVPIFLDPLYGFLFYPGCSTIHPPVPLLTRNTTEKIFGFVNGVLVYQNFFTSALGGIVIPDVDVFIFDTTLKNASSFIGRVQGAYSHSEISDYKYDNAGLLISQVRGMEIMLKETLEVADREWTVLVGAREGYLSARRTFAPLVLLLLSIFTSVVPIFAGAVHFWMMRDSEEFPTGNRITPASSTSSVSMISVKTAFKDSK